ncbi:MAG: ABC transporter ATP-binding protein [Desulfobacterales bacterium]|nr:ABC transporter ATP-binding protein [Desulfobacterales bacterium]
MADADTREDVQAPLVRVRNLSKGYDSNGLRIDVLEQTDFDLEAGETVAVVGTSGIGKSTFLHVLGTLDRPDEGSFLFQGRDVFAFDSDRLACFRNQAIGFVFQFHHLLPEFNALENAMMPALISGMGRSEARDRAASILTRVGLDRRLNHRVGKLSGGEQQRVALARALVLNPKLLLADEPTGNLDRQNSAHVHDLLLSLNREFSMSLVVVTHNTELASYMSRRVTIVDGKLVDTN